uniref:Uncharacterized protein n=1 Tax=Ficus carica TaxID=3494 RepID=A0AA87ZFI2_FICCA|nr:hypothetical protein TIFTF001_048113 [Ficus carica]GMN31715.1 hypothetical protein TIFTF001_048117 [Ficus carica]
MEVARTTAKPAASTVIPVTRPTGSVETAQAIIRPSICQLRQDCKGRHKTCCLHDKTPETGKPVTSVIRPTARPAASTTMPTARPADAAARPVTSVLKPASSATRTAYFALKTASSAKTARAFARPLTCQLRQDCMAYHITCRLHGVVFAETTRLAASAGTRTVTKPTVSTVIPVAIPAGSAEPARAIVRPLACQLRLDYKGRHKTYRIHDKTPKTAKPVASTTRPTTRPAASTTMAAARLAGAAARPVISAPRPTGSATRTVYSALRTTSFAETTRAFARPPTRQLRQDCKARHKTRRLHDVVSAETTRLAASVGKSANRFFSSAN